MDVSGGEYRISPSIIDSSLISASLLARDGFGRSSRRADALQSPDHDPVAVRVASGSAAIAFAVAIRATGVQNAGQLPLPTLRPPEWCVQCPSIHHLLPGTLGSGSRLGRGLMVPPLVGTPAVSYTHLRAHETRHDL